MRYSKTRYGHIKPERIKYLAERFKLSERFVKILLNRGLKTEAEIKKFLEPKIEDLHDPFLMKGMREAVYRTRLAIDRKERILVFGDFDADGIVATYILKQALLENGAKDVFHFLPHRVDDGYGLTEKTIEYSTKKFKPDLIITVDCGISAHKEVELIKAMGIDIIITDHHEIPETMPATHVVNTLQEGCKYPFKDLCGAGISFKLVEALFGRTYAKKFLAPLSIATIADIVSLTGENRVLVSLGLADAARFPKGIRALIKHLKIDRLTSSEIAFKVAPKINAPGRMGNAEPSIELFFEQDEKKIKALIEKIENLNVMRRERGQVVQEDAEREVKKHNLSTSRSIVLKNEKWEQGVLGIAASKLSNDFKRPTILFSKIDTVLKGSGRSINGIDMVEMLTDINKKGLILNFGGHEMAAGLSIREENFLEFKKEVELWLDRKELDQHYETKREFDEFITEEEITDAFVNELMLLEPTGQENRQPTFKLDFKQCEVSQLKKASPHISLKLQKGQRIISFNGVKYLNALNSKCSKQVLLEFGRENFRGKEGIKAEAKSFNFLYFEADEKLELGVKMLQYAMLFGNIPRKISKMSMFRKVEEKELGNVV
ncbi:MAG: single-stranded-DNA-specific exonuclease RecJ, partial [Firmicutes bacterium]|nr:single-stranded-DNA-specific exonuclease RecJ [Bacillota bacterium]